MKFTDESASSCHFHVERRLFQHERMRSEDVLQDALSLGDVVAVADADVMSTRRVSLPVTLTMLLPQMDPLGTTTTWLSKRLDGCGVQVHRLQRFR
jgi:hypothetical protein